MALRLVADRVDKQLHDYMQQKRIKGPWKTGLHILVAMGCSPYSAKLLRWAKVFLIQWMQKFRLFMLKQPITLQLKNKGTV